jgi:hypothetical protein
MLFSFYLGNHSLGQVGKMREVMAPIHHGLVEAGHRVIDFGFNLLPGPAVNVLVENFTDDDETDGILRLKSEQGDRLHFGIVCPVDVEDDEAMESATHPRRLANLRRLLPVADFVWTFLPQTALYETWAGAGKAAPLEMGFTERLVTRQLIPTAGLRDLDVLVIGRETPHREATVRNCAGAVSRASPPARSRCPGSRWMIWSAAPSSCSTSADIQACATHRRHGS